MKHELLTRLNVGGLFKSWLTDWLAREMGIDREKIDPRQSFLSYGMDSVQAMTMVGDLEAKLEVRLPPTLAWDFPDIDALSSHLAERMTDVTSRHLSASSRKRHPSPPRRMATACEPISNPARVDIDDMHEPRRQSVIAREPRVTDACRNP